MLGRAFASGVPASWVVGDSVYGDARHLRWWLEGQEKQLIQTHLVRKNKSAVLLGFSKTHLVPDCLLSEI